MAVAGSRKDNNAAEASLSGWQSLILQDDMRKKARSTGSQLVLPARPEGGSLSWNGIGARSHGFTQHEQSIFPKDVHMMSYHDHTHFSPKHEGEN